MVAAIGLHKSRLVRVLLLFSLCLTGSVFAHLHPAHDLIEVKHGKEARILCRKCGAELTTRGSHVRAVYKPDSERRKISIIPDPEGALEGDAPLHNMTNPAGHDFQVALFEKVQVSSQGDLLAADSFFPTFKSQITTCNRCGAHLGWLFVGPPQSQAKKAKTCAKRAAANHVIKKARSSSGGTSRLPHTDHSPEMRFYHLVDKLLKNKCIVFLAGWWNFQYCHKKEIRQYHPEPNGRRGQDWSLGTFLTVQNTLDAKTDILRTKHLFRDGQHCDETGGGRSTDVSFKNCMGDTSDLAKAANQEGEVAYITGIREPAVCSYSLDICILDPSLDAWLPVEASSASCTEEGAKSNSSKELSRFHGLLWSSVVAEDVDEVSWIHKMKLRL